MRRSAACLAIALCLSACGGGNTESSVQAPGAEETAATRTLEAGAAALQSRPPIEAINAYLDGFHFYNGQMNVQMEAHHYCAILNEEVIQCVIYDGNVKDAKLMGVEYIISEALFSGLPEQEKALWHSHVHEVASGQLVAPGIPEVAEHALMEKLIHTYGKTWHTWHTDLDKDLPRGVPQLMMGFTADGQADPRWWRPVTGASAWTARKSGRIARTFQHLPWQLAPMPGRQEKSSRSRTRPASRMGMRTSRRVRLFRPMRTPDPTTTSSPDRGGAALASLSRP